jgi:hypothetical protein
VLTNLFFVGINFITYHSTAACSPDCASVTGVDLKNSQAVYTINLNNQGLGAGSSFYARWTGVRLTNGGSIGAVMGQTVSLNNSGNITIGSSTTSGGSWSWDVRYYEQL